VHQVGVSLHVYIEMHGQQNLKNRLHVAHVNFISNGIPF